MRSSWIRVGPKSNSNCLYKGHKEDVEHREEAAENGGRDWGYEVQTKDCRQPQEARREAWNGFSLRQETNPDKTLILEFQHSEL